VARWPDFCATGIGSMPGASIRESVQLVLDELVDLPHLPELPARGPGADMVGRALGLLPDFPADWGPTGWALADRPGHDTRQANAWLGEDLDVVEELLEGWTGPFKVQMCGPWTLAASVELRSGRKVLADAGARRDLVQAYADGLGAHVGDVRRRLPAAQLLVQLDEPALGYVLDGEVPTPSGLTRIAAIDQEVVLRALASATGAVQAADVAGAVGGVGEAGTGVHCCGGSPPLRLLGQLHANGGTARPGLDFASVDLAVLTPRDDDSVGEALEAGLALMLGVPAAQAPGDRSGSAQVDRLAATVRGLWRRLGLPTDQLARVVVTPSCGLAGADSPAQVRAALSACAAVARQIRDDPQGPA